MILSAAADADARTPPLIVLSSLGGSPAQWLMGRSAGWLAGWLNVWHHGVTIIPSNTQKPKEDLAAAAAAAAAPQRNGGADRMARGISSRLEGSTLDKLEG